MSSQGRRLPRAKGKAETTSSIGGKCPKVRGLSKRPGHPMFPLRSRSGHGGPHHPASQDISEMKAQGPSLQPHNYRGSYLEVEGDFGQQEFGVNVHQLPVAVMQMSLRREPRVRACRPRNAPKTLQGLATLWGKRARRGGKVQEAS